MRNKFKKRAEFRYIAGTISLHPDGYGFVKSEEKSLPEIFIPGSQVKGALSGDRVLVKIKSGFTHPERLKGRVVRIKERAITELIGAFNGEYIKPRDQKIPYWFYVPEQHSLNAHSGELVRAKITSYPGESGQASAEIIEVLGKELSISLESRLILEQFGFSEQLPAGVEKELLTIPESVGKKDLENRMDLTGVPLITIDPEDARDFDDAVAVKKTGSGYQLWVAIAEVSHYVKPMSQLDLSAYQKGTSVYFPARAIPMLPERISAGIASLKPNQKRLAMVAEMLFDGSGNQVSEKFYPAVIKSRFRMNYDEVQEILDQKSPKLAKRYNSILALLFEMKELAEVLYKRRRKRGAIDLDLPEAKVLLNEKGEPVDIYPYPRFFSHRIIEEFMLSANQSVARFLAGKKITFPYRIHERPEPAKIRELNLFLSVLGVPLLKKNQLPEQIEPKDFQELLDRIANSPLSSLISYLALRSMTQAKYSIENKGHFGLALSDYCHFTSPIRRYPDLVVHRVLKSALGVDGEKPFAPEELKIASEHCSEQERASQEAEREMLKVYQLELFKKYVGQEFPASVSGITNFGIFAMIERPLAEGLIPAYELSDYRYLEKLHTAIIGSTKSEIHLGDRILVQVQSLNPELRQIQFRLVKRLKPSITQSLVSYFPEPAQRKPSRRKKFRRRMRGPGSRF